MDTIVDFKKIWQQQTAEQPDVKKMLVILKTFRQKKIMRLLIANILLLFTCIYIVWAVYYFDPDYITTCLGAYITVMAMLVFIFSYNKLLINYKDLSSTDTNKMYIQKLKIIKEKEHRIQTRSLTLYFVMLSNGIALYLYEYLLKMPLILAVIFSVFTLLWIAFSWFYLRPKQIRLQQKKTDHLIQKLEQLSVQFRYKE